MYLMKFFDAGMASQMKISKYRLKLMEYARKEKDNLSFDIHEDITWIRIKDRRIGVISLIEQI